MQSAVSGDFAIETLWQQQSGVPYSGRSEGGCCTLFCPLLSILFHSKLQCVERRGEIKPLNGSFGSKVLNIGHDVYV